MGTHGENGVMIDILRRAYRLALMVGVSTLLALGLFGLDKAKAQSSVAVSFFYEDLSPYGYWVRDPYYGTVWYPDHRTPGWQPYVNGRWVYTVEYGWYWESEEQWGWATYHYGRWVYTAGYGWVWVPGDEWAPAWVEWRYGGGYVGWTPLPPEATWRSNVVVYGSIDLSAPRYHPGWVFVAEADFARGSIETRRAPAWRNSAMIGATARAGGYASVNGRIVNRGVDANLVSAAAKVRIAPVVVMHSQSRIDGPRVAGRITIYQPRVVARATVGGAIDQGPARIENESTVRVRPSTIPQIGGGVGGSIDAGRGGGLGVGVGGGLRIGR
jgi:hypothetical protein